MRSVSDIRSKVERSMTLSGVRKGEHLLLALSGGADSLSLLDILLSVAPGSEMRLSAAHLDHSMRGDRSEEDARVVESLCAGRNIPVILGKLTRSEVQTRKNKLNSTEAALRELRYEFLKDAARKTGADWIVTAHHSDDQAETVLFRALRRMNWRSLAGMRAVESNIIRPLLEITRAEIESYCSAKGLIHLEDETNLDLSFSRNRIRHHTIPGLEKSFNPSIKSALIQISRCCRKLGEWEEKALEGFNQFGSASLFDAGFDIELYAQVPEELREGLTLKLLGSVLNVQPKGTLLADTMKMLSGTAPGSLKLPGGSTLEFEKGYVHHEGPRPERYPKRRLQVAERSLNIPGSVEIPELGRGIMADFAEYNGLESFPGGDDILVNAEKISPPLVVRNRRPKDTFKPLGMKGEKKLKDFFIDRKVPMRSRDLIPLVFDSDRVLVWVAGVEISEKVRLEKGVRSKAIRLRVEKL